MHTVRLLIEPVTNGYRVGKRDEARYRPSVVDESDYVFQDFKALVIFLAEHIAPAVDGARTKQLLEDW